MEKLYVAIITTKIPLCEGHDNCWSPLLEVRIFFFRNSLQSVYILDGLMDGYPVPYISQTDEDPFVMLAWRCNKLQDFSLLGKLIKATGPFSPMY